MTLTVQSVAVLGSTGSIGVSTLDVIARHPERFKVFALTASTSVSAMLAQCRVHQPEFAVMASEPHGKALEQQCADHGLRTRVLWGAHAIEQMASHEKVTTVMAAIVGAAGLASCLAAARSGKRLLLANKEALVVGGAVFMQAVAQGRCTLLPIDSEHSAIFQSLPFERAQWPLQVQKLILTASGGPFRTHDPVTFPSLTPAQACAHPNWVMGRKISVDSATMMNKALEVIEARFLFDIEPEKIEVVIHPQSVIHSMVQYVDHSVVAQLGTPDMRGPIAYGLAWPERVASGAAALDFASMANLSFENASSDAHRSRYPGLELAWQVLAATAGTPAVLNAANEVGVAAFLEGRIRFDQIHHVNRQTLDDVNVREPGCLSDLLELDARSRSQAQAVVAGLAV